MIDSFSSGKTSTRVPSSQKVADRQKEQETQRTFSIVWRQTSATFGKEVFIDVTANIAVNAAALIGISIMFNNSEKVGDAEIVEVNGKKITAKWKVKARNSGLFTAGSYSAQLTYNGTFMATTGTPLKIVAAVSHADGFDAVKR